MRAGFRLWLLPCLLASLSCASQQTIVADSMAKFNRALCPKDPPPDLSKPEDPEIEGARAALGTPDRVVPIAGNLRVELTMRNAGLHRMVLNLPQQAFTLEGFELVDHNCVPVRYVKPPTAHALAYRTSGPMPLGIGESATLDSTLDGLAPGLELPRGIYAIRFALRLEPAGASLRSKTLYSDWALFAVTGRKPPQP